MTALLALLGRWGVPPEFRRLILGLLGLLLVIAVVFTAMRMHDRKVIANHDTEVNLDAATKDRAADNKAAEQRHVDDVRAAQEATQLEKAYDHAPTDPAVPDELERKRAFYRCLRLQQAARANGEQPPACV